MATVLFITAEDIKKRSPMGGNVDSDKYNQSVFHVQRTQLLPIIGEDLYDRIVTEIGGIVSASIQALLDGAMKDLIVNYAAADYSLLANYNMTNGGVSSYQPDNGFPVNTDEVIRLTERLEDRAKFYGQELIKFLNTNKADYPEWKGSSTNSNYFGWNTDEGGNCPNNW